MILVFGSLNMDLVMRVPALPQPGETVLCTSYVTKPGGKGHNQAVAAARAGSQVIMAGRVGRDEFGRRLTDNLRGHGIDCTGVVPVDEPTGCAAICVDPQGQNMITVASGANLAASADLVNDRTIGPGATLLMQMEVPPEQNWALVRRVGGAGMRIVLSLAPAGPVPLDTLKRIDVLIANAMEAPVLARDLGVTSEEDAGALARGLAVATGNTFVITRGAAGAVAAAGGELWAVDAPEITAVDTTGAGDTFTGIFAAAADAGTPLPDALRRASVGAALACLAVGAQESMPTIETIESNLDRVPPPRRLA